MFKEKAFNVKVKTEIEDLIDKTMEEMKEAKLDLIEKEYSFNGAEILNIMFLIVSIAIALSGTTSKFFGEVLFFTGMAIGFLISIIFYNLIYYKRIKWL